ncbi:M16 family metallopeptidase [Massilia niabensis]|uniref:M16 family metallopeptidase n=1 Tax=Massilia niabensis TaxID=544910 RepID=A0ABW0LBH4_9BURK
MPFLVLRHVCSIAALSLCLGSADAAVDLTEPLRFERELKVGKLANGLTYYIKRNARPEKQLELQLVVKVGSIVEDDDQQGLAHFVEHMGFNGSANFKKTELLSYLQSIGVKVGPDLNARTSYDETVYKLLIPTGRQEHVDKGFLVLSDWAQGMTLDAAAIDAERGVILEEARQRNGATYRMHRSLSSNWFGIGESRYSKRTPIGQEDIIRNAPPEALRRFYKDWYRPDLMAVIVVGDIDPAAAEKMIETHFGAMAMPAKPRPRVYTNMVAHRSTNARVATDVEATTNSLSIRYPLAERPPRRTVGDYRALQVRNLFNFMLNRRLQQLTQLPEPPFLRAQTAYHPMGKGHQAFAIDATLARGGAAPAIAALTQESARVREFGFSQSELDTARKSMSRNVELQYADRDKVSSSAFVGAYVGSFLNDEVSPGLEDIYRFARELLPTIHLAEIQQYARATLPANAPRILAFTGKDKPEAPAPSRHELLAALAAADKAPVTAREEKGFASSLLDSTPTGGTIAVETQDAAVGLTRLTLSNGVKVILKKTDFRNEQVVMRAVRFGGTTLYKPEDDLNGRLSTALVSTMGWGAHSPVALNHILAGKSLGLAINMGEHTEHVTGGAAPADLETLLQAIYLRFTTVRRDEDLFKSFINKQIEGTRDAMASPAMVIDDAMRMTLYDRHPRVARMPTPEALRNVALDRSIALYKERFSSARDMTFIFVGNFDPVTFKPLLATYLGSLPTGEIAVGFRDLGFRPVTGVVKKEVRRGKNDQSVIALNFTGPATYSSAERVRFRTLVEIARLRLTAVLRDKSLVYSVNLNGTLSHLPYGHYQVAARLPTAPDKVDRLLAMLFAEIEALKTRGPDASDLQKVQQAALQGHQRSLKENGAWAALLEGALLTDTDPAERLAQDSKIGELTVDDIKAAARLYFNTGNYVQVVMNPEKWWQSTSGQPE